MNNKTGAKGSKIPKYEELLRNLQMKSPMSEYQKVTYDSTLLSYEKAVSALSEQDPIAGQAAQERMQEYTQDLETAMPDDDIKHVTQKVVCNDCGSCENLLRHLKIIRGVVKEQMDKTGVDTLKTVGDALARGQKYREQICERK